MPSNEPFHPLLLSIWFLLLIFTLHTLFVAMPGNPPQALWSLKQPFVNRVCMKFEYIMKLPYRPYALTSSRHHVGGTSHCFVCACGLRLAHFWQLRLRVILLTPKRGCHEIMMSYACIDVITPPCWWYKPLLCTCLWSATDTFLTTVFTRNPIDPQGRAPWDYDVICIRSIDITFHQYCLHTLPGLGLLCPLFLMTSSYLTRFLRMNSEVATTLTCHYQRNLQATIIEQISEEFSFSFILYL